MRKTILFLLIALLLVACDASATTGGDSPAAETPFPLPSVTPPAPEAAPTDEPATPEASATPEGADLSSAVLSLRRTECFGTCPVYTVTIDGDGSVHWLGERWVEVEGEATSSADPAEAQSLIRAFLDAGFMEMNDEYTEECDAQGNCTTVSDLPGQIFTLTVDGQEKVVRNVYGGPEVLAELAARVDALANTEQWIGTPNE